MSVFSAITGTIAGLPFLNISKGVSVDPVTAINNCITAFFSFLNTPAGQKFAMDQIAIGEKFNTQLADFFDHIHTQLTAPKTGA